MSPALRKALFTLLFALLSCLPGCGGSNQGSGRDQLVVVQQRLSGSWRVQTFTPEQQLELPLQSLLNAQLGNLVITFSQGSYTAKGVGIDLTGRFQLLTGGGDLLEGIFYDSTGVGYRISGQFEGPVLKFRSYDAPWRGTGTMVR
ncbi:MAG: hypothetical protein ACOY0T_32415 [Myxococcota bacterium]